MSSPPPTIDKKYLLLLSQSFPTIAQASAEIINLEAILHLPKGTEHFLADLHGEHQAFLHVLKNASGNIKRKVNDLYGSTMTLQEKRDFCTLIYYPEQKLRMLKTQEKDLDSWYHTTITRLIAVCREVSSKYTRSRVRKVLPKEFAYIIEELLHESSSDINKAAYVDVIITTIITTGSADEFIIAIAHVIQKLTIDRLHILGDIFDRGPGAHIIMDTLISYHDWDIQWGNHDILWMGASVGNMACVCNVIRLCMRYGNLSTLEDGYGISIMPLATFALEAYANDPCPVFMPKLLGKDDDDKKLIQLTAKMHKAITILQFKAEAQTILRHPEWHMSDRTLLDKIDYTTGTITLNGTTYPLKTNNFHTIDPADPIAFNAEEALLMRKLCHSFCVSDKLQRHIRSILRHGSMYSICNDNLLFHAAIPLTADGTPAMVTIRGKEYAGRALFDAIDRLIHLAFEKDANTLDKEYAQDYFMYLWCGPDSPLFNKSKMATFERYFLEDKASHVEEKGNYFLLRDREDVADKILDAFGVTGKHRHIINGHVPVHVASGENPIKANGKIMVIDGGFAQAYHKETGIAGYTLVYHSRGFQLVQHEPFTNTDDAIRSGVDIKSTTQIIEMSDHRMLVADTDTGKDIQEQVDNLKALLSAYRHGWIKEG